MDRNDEFSQGEEITKPQNEDGYFSWTMELSTITYQNNTYGLYLKRVPDEGFFKPYNGAIPKHLYFSIREINGKRYIFIDENHQIKEGLIKLSDNCSRPLYTHCVRRTVYGEKTEKYSIVIPCQIITHFPEIKTTKKIQAVRVPIPGRPLDVRYQLILK